MIIDLKLSEDQIIYSGNGLNKDQFDLDAVVGQLKHKIDDRDLGRLLKLCAQIMIIGKLNVGKSSLINYIFNLPIKNQAKTNRFFPTTQTITKYCASKGSGILMLYDTPGISESWETDEKHLIEIRKCITSCDLILCLLPYEFVGTTYEQIFKWFEKWGQSKLIRERVVFAITKSDELISNLKEMTFNDYINKYAECLNKFVFRDIKYKIKPEELNVVSIHNKKQIESLLLLMLLKVSDSGFLGIIKFLDKKKFSDITNDIKKKVSDWLGRNIRAEIDNNTQNIFQTFIKLVLRIIGLPI